MTSNGSTEFLWDCRHCGSEGLLARTEAYCRFCGSLQDKEHRYLASPTFASNPKAAISCGGCLSLTAVDSRFCSHCGAQVECDLLPGDTSADLAINPLEGEDSKAGTPSQETIQLAEPLIFAPSPTSRRRLAAILTTLLSGLGMIFVWTQPQSVEVIGHQWVKGVKIERYLPSNETSWCHQVPTGAYQIERRSFFETFRNIPDAEDCYLQPTQTAHKKQECQPRFLTEPLYDRLCDYRINRWHPVRSVLTEGNDIHPLDPESGMIGSKACLGCEREGEHFGEYQLRLRTKDHREFSCPLPFEDWQSTRDGDQRQIEIGRIDGIPRCRTLLGASNQLQSS